MLPVRSARVIFSSVRAVALGAQLRLADEQRHGHRGPDLDVPDLHEANEDRVATGQQRMRKTVVITGTLERLGSVSGVIQPLFEYRLQLARLRDARARAGGRRAAGGALPRLRRQRRHLAPVSRHPGPPGPARARRRPARGFGTAGRLARSRSCPQLDRFALAVVRHAAGRRRTPAIVAGNSLGGCVALRLAERHPDALAGVVGAAPAGLEMNRLLHLVQHDPVVRSLVVAALSGALGGDARRPSPASIAGWPSPRPPRSTPPSSRPSPITTAVAAASPSTSTSPIGSSRSCARRWH